MTQLTREELVDLYMLCDREADMFDYDKDVYERFTELSAKICQIIEELHEVV